ncbi:MAG: hypothetical protein ACREFU_14450 [Acetobacteraceae bacterium]
MLPKVTATLQKSASAADAAAKAIAALPDSPKLATGIDILLKANAASPSVNGLKGRPEAASAPFFHLAVTLPTLSDQNREPIFKTPAERHDKIESGMIDSAAKAIATAPVTAAGIIALLEQRQDLAHIADPAAHAQLATEIDRRITQIRDGLHQATHAVWSSRTPSSERSRPPTCRTGCSAGSRSPDLAIAADNGRRWPPRRLVGC